MDRLPRVLVVEDDAGIRHMVGLALEAAGHDVRTFDGRDRVERGDADVLVLDVRLGRRSAQDLLAEQPELAGLPLVLITASASTDQAAAGLPEPVALLSKPFDLADLETAVRQVAETGAPRESAPERRAG